MARILCWMAAALRADLHDALVLARGLDHLAAFPHVVAGGLLDVDVLAGLAGPDGGQRVPVVGRGDGDGVDFLVVEELAHVAVDPGLGALELLDLRRSAFLRFLVHVADGRHTAFRQLRVFGDVGPATASDSDDGDVDSVIGAEDAVRGGGDGRRGRGKNGTSGGMLHSVDYIYPGGASRSVMWAKGGAGNSTAESRRAISV